MRQYLAQYPAVPSSVPWKPRGSGPAPSVGRKSVENSLSNVTSRPGRFALITVGVVALIVGGVFAGQGLNLIPGSFMTGNRMWLAIGLIVAIVGIILIVLGLRRPGHDRTRG